MTQDAGLASFAATIAAWLFICSLIIVAGLLFTGRGKVDDAAAHADNDGDESADVDGFGPRGSAA